MPRRPDTTPEISAMPYPEHPLFPVEEGETAPLVAFVQITRFDRGQQYWGPVLRADELTTTDELFQMYGGGHYELWARGFSKLNGNDRPGNITKKKRFMLAGKSKPMSNDPTPEEIRQAEGNARPFEAGAIAAPAVAAPSSSAAGEGLLVAVLNMQQQSSQNFMTLMVQMLTDSKKEAAETAKLQAAQLQQFSQMMMTLSGQQQQSMIGMMTAMLQSRGGGPEEMAKYADLLRKLGMGGAKPDDDKEPEGFGKMLEDAADFVQGVVALKGASPPVNGQPVIAPAPGSAAAVAAEVASRG